MYTIVSVRSASMEPVVLPHDMGLPVTGSRARPCQGYLYEARDRATNIDTLIPKILKLEVHSQCSHLAIR